MPTDQDLRLLLNELAADGARDVLHVRRIIDDRTTVSDRPRRRVDRRRLLGVVAVAAVAVVAVVLALSLTGRSSTPQPAGPPPLTPVPTLYPGARVIDTIRGTGNADLNLDLPRVRADHEITATVICSRPETITVGGTEAMTCPTVAGDGGTVSGPRLEVRTAADNRWAITVVDEPRTQTNGAVLTPAVDITSRRGTPLAIASGRGTRTVSFPATPAEAFPSPGVPLVPGNPVTGGARIELVCQGSGVSFSSRDHSADGQYTRTCFAGSSYEFTLTNLSSPGRLTVTASPDTTWTVQVDRD